MLVSRVVLQISAVPTRNLTYSKFRTWYANLVQPKPTRPPYRHVVQIGDPVLRTIADKVPVELIKSKEINDVLQKMYNILRKYNCIGISATQIGVAHRIIMLEFNEKHAKTFSTEEFRNREMSLMPLTVCFI